MNAAGSFLLALSIIAWTNLAQAQSILFENDFFAVGQRDRFLTNHVVASWEPYSIGSEMYTPETKDNPLVPKGDRPWDGYSYVEYADIYPVDKNEVRIFRYRFGGVGDASGAKHLQRFVHNDLGIGIDPKGWETANPSEITADFVYQHQFRSRFDSWLGAAELLHEYGLRFGNVRVSGWLEQEARRGIFVEDDFAVFVFAGLRGEVKAYDTHLDGRLFRNNHYTIDAVPFVAWAVAGVGVNYGEWFARYGYKYQTEEFRGQDGRHLYGSFSLGLSF